MSSVIFQPLLHDPLGWKSSKSTYTDHYKWKKYRSASKEKKNFSTYGQQRYQRDAPRPSTTPNKQTATRDEPIIVTNQNEENRGRTSAFRSASAKTLVVTEQTPMVTHVEEKIRPVSASEVNENLLIERFFF